MHKIVKHEVIRYPIATLMIQKWQAMLKDYERSDQFP
jgi:hypothetical protein